MTTATATQTGPPTGAKPLVLTIEQTAEVLSVSTFTVRRRIRDKSIPHVKIGGVIRVPYERLRKMLNGEMVK